jgi:hypothetical protein
MELNQRWEWQKRGCVGDGMMDAQSQSRLLKSVRGFVRSLVEDICNGRSPLVALDRFRTYCSDPSGNCACSFDAPFAKEFISIDRQPHAAHRLGSPFSFLVFSVLILSVCPRIGVFMDSLH